MQEQQMSESVCPDIRIVALHKLIESESSEEEDDVEIVKIQFNPNWKKRKYNQFNNSITQISQDNVHQNQIHSQVPRPVIKSFIPIAPKAPPPPTVTELTAKLEDRITSEIQNILADEIETTITKEEPISVTTNNNNNSVTTTATSQIVRPVSLSECVKFIQCPKCNSTFLSSQGLKSHTLNSTFCRSSEEEDVLRTDSLLILTRKELMEVDEEDEENSDQEQSKSDLKAGKNTKQKTSQDQGIKKRGRPAAALKTKQVTKKPKIIPRKLPVRTTRSTKSMCTRKTRSSKRREDSSDSETESELESASSSSEEEEEEEDTDPDWEDEFVKVKSSKTKSESSTTEIPKKEKDEPQQLSKISKTESLEEPEDSARYGLYCSKCDKDFATQRSLARHTTMVHKNNAG